jgi:hypothetical protein
LTIIGRIPWCVVFFFTCHNSQFRCLKAVANS